MQFEDFDSALPHLEHEVVTVLLRLVHPENVAEQQIVPVVRVQPVVGKLRTADQDGPQRADFTMNAEGVHDGHLENES